MLQQTSREGVATAMDSAALVVDFDADGRIVGIEIPGASRVLRPETTKAAGDITRRS